MRVLLAAATALFACGESFAGQAHAADAAVEGLVMNLSGAAVPNALVIVRNQGTGLRREAHTDQAGRYRIQWLTPGSYSVRISCDTFAPYNRSGLRLGSGSVAVVNARLADGPVQEAITVNADAPLTRPASVDSGAALMAAELNRVPSVLKNPVNTALLFPGVNGYETNELAQPRLSANGSQVRNHFQLDGTSNTLRDQAGLRLMNLSAIMVSELSVTTSGFAPQFGQATGLVLNVVTPSGTNRHAGSARFDFSTPDMIARSPLAASGDPVPRTRSLDAAVTSGGPIVRDQFHYYWGYEWIRRDPNAKPIVIQRDAAARFGLALPAGGLVDDHQDEHYYIVKLDDQASRRHYVSGRVTGFVNDAPSTGSGGLVAPERMIDIFVQMSSAALKVTSTFNSSVLNELQVQRSARRMSRTASPLAATGPAIDVKGVVGFGGPRATRQDADSDFYERNWQVMDNVSWARRGHVLKAGMDVQRGYDRRVNTSRRLFAFESPDRYLLARDGINPFAYATYIEDSGNQTLVMRSTLLAGFIQDDFPIGTRLHLQTGVRYDVFAAPSTAGTSARAFGTDLNNIAPRFGAAWALDANASTVLRTSLGKLYDVPLLALFQDVLLTHRTDSRTLVLTPTTAGAPPFPSPAQGASSGAAPSIVEMNAVMPTQQAWLFHLELERSIRSRAVVSAGYTRSSGRHLPVLVDSNLVPTGAFLPDGRPLYDPGSRVDPAYDHKDVIEPAGRAHYEGLVLGFRSGLFAGASINASYTLGLGRDSSPLTNTYVIGSRDDRLSDPSNVERDFGRSPFDQRHTLSVLGSAQSLGVPGLAVSFTAQVGSGMAANIVSNRDLNRDGLLNDRPSWLARNSASTGRTATVDVKVSQQLWSSQRTTVRTFVSVKNLFNTTNPSTIRRVLPTDINGDAQKDMSTALEAVDVFSPRRVLFGLALDY